MHKNILSPSQVKTLPLLKEFSGKFGLVGGTAIALQLGHRRSNDFDLFSPVAFKNSGIMAIVKKYGIPRVYVDDINEITLALFDVKMTFYHYSFPVNYSVNFDSVAKMPDLSTLAAMKAFALGRRAKWKDYVDLYFLLQKLGFEAIVGKAKETYAHEFSEKMFREQLSYFDDINYSEKVDFMPGFEIPDEKIKEKLVDFATI